MTLGCSRVRLLRVLAGQRLKLRAGLLRCSSQFIAARARTVAPTRRRRLPWKGSGARSDARPRAATGGSMSDKDTPRRLEQLRGEWRERYAAKGERDADFTTLSGEPLEPIYSSLDHPVTDEPGQLGFPGLYPYTRGIHPSMYRGRPWTIRQFSGFGNARETNARYRYLIAQGGGGLSVAFD